MASLSVIVSRLWGVYVTNAVITGWCITNINPYNTSLLYAWMVCLCDLVYIIDAFTRTSKRVYRFAFTADLELLVNYKSPLFLFDISLFPCKIFTLIPFHVLAILELDESGVYFVECLLRVVVLSTSGRFHVGSAFFKSSNRGRVHAAQEKRGPVNANQRQKSERNRQ